MAGRINDEDLETVRQRARIEDIVGATVALRNAGGGALTGLCPFHDEKTPSFRVTPSRGFYYCFGCGKGGDVISFVQELNNVSFTEAVQFLADKVGIQLRFSEDGPRQAPGGRMRILEANKVAAEYFSEQLHTQEGLAGRQFLAERGFDQNSAERFGIGYAPQDGKALGRHLKGRGFTDDELVRAGLIRANGWDFFQGRLLWPIRDSGASVLGFGARRLSDTDRMPAKYINTPETPVYKKSNVLYGLDLARSAIGKKNQAVVVEGYTDVMAAHLAGVDTAVASCGTAFGEEHAKLIARLMGTDALGGEVIFTFDGDAAGQNAALKVFSLDSAFISQTYVAVEPSGLDPCDLRLQQGEAAVRELVARRVPLYRFVMRNAIDQFDLDRADGRLGALRAVAPLVSSVRDVSLLGEYARELSGMIGVDIDQVRQAVKVASHRSPKPTPDKVRRTFDGPPPPEPPDEDAPPEDDEMPVVTEGLPMPDARDRSLDAERNVLKVMMQAPESFLPGWNGVTAEDFRHPAYRMLFATASEVARSSEWVRSVREAATDPTVDQLAIALSVEPLLREATPRHAQEYAAKVQMLRLVYQINELKGRLQRTNPVEHPEDHRRMFAKLIDLERRRAELQHLVSGPSDGP